MKNIKLPQEIFTRYRLESMGDESDTGYLSEKYRTVYKIALSPRFSDEVPEKILNAVKDKLDTLIHYDKRLYENLSDKDTESTIKYLAEIN